VEGLLRVSRAIDGFNLKVGRWVSWLILAAVLVSTINAIIRKLFNVSSNSWLEAQWYLFGAVFMFCSAYTLYNNEHIRIDIVNSRFSKPIRDWIDVIGHVFFLMPFAGLMVWYGVPFALHSISNDLPGLITGLGVIIKNSALNLVDLFSANPAYRVVQLVPGWEQSLNAGGLYVWPAKFLIPLGFFTLFLQGVSELIKRIAIIRGEMEDPREGAGGHHGAVEAEAERLLQQAGVHN